MKLIFSVFIQDRNIPLALRPTHQLAQMLELQKITRTEKDTGLTTDGNGDFFTVFFLATRRTPPMAAKTIATHLKYSRNRPGQAVQKRICR